MVEELVLRFSGDKAARLRQVKALAARRGFTFVGNTQKGEFSGDTLLGKVSGTYSISGETITVTITQRPSFLSVGRIKNEFEKFLRET